jgi:hypothetical protein
MIAKPAPGPVIKEWVRLIALTRWVTQAHEALQSAIEGVERDYSGLAKWCAVDVVATSGAGVRLVVKPTEAAADLLAAGKALCEDEGGVQRSARAQALLDVLRCDVQAGNNVGEKGHANNS